MKNKYFSLLLVGLALLPLSFAISCAGKASIEPKVYEFAANRAEGESATTQRSFQLKIGDRVEGEVNASEDSAKVRVLDPYSNILTETSIRTQSIQGYAMSYSTQEYPWQFAFYAATDGEYIIQISSQPDVIINIKITVYGE